MSNNHKEIDTKNVPNTHYNEGRHNNHQKVRQIKQIKFKSKKIQLKNYKLSKPIIILNKLNKTLIDLKLWMIRYEIRNLLT